MFNRPESEDGFSEAERLAFLDAIGDEDEEEGEEYPHFEREEWDDMEMPDEWA